MDGVRRDDLSDVIGNPVTIAGRLSQRIVDPSGIGIGFPERLELARISVPAGQVGIVRTVWQLLSVAPGESDPAPQAGLVTDPAYPFYLQDPPIWHLVLRYDDDDREIPTFPQDSQDLDPFRGPEPAEGWNIDGFRYLFPWGSPIEQRILVPAQASLSLYVDFPGQDASGIGIVGGLLRGESRVIVDTPEFRAWYGRR